MFKRLRYVFVLFICIGIIMYGFITVSNVMPDFIKDRSNLKLSYTKKPFDLEIDTGDYIIYMNSKAVENYKKGIGNITKNIVSNNPIKKILK